MKMIFDYTDGDYFTTRSDNMAMDLDGHMMRRMSDTMSVDMETGDIHYTSFWSDDEDEE